MNQITLGDLMLSIILSAYALVGLTMVIHASSVAVLLHGLMKSDTLPATHVWPIMRMLLRMIWRPIRIHLSEISVWALF